MNNLKVYYPIYKNGIKTKLKQVVFNAMLTDAEFDKVKHAHFHTSKTFKCIACSEFGQLEKLFQRKIERVEVININNIEKHGDYISDS